jgi:hypothetical protein
MDRMTHHWSSGARGAAGSEGPSAPPPANHGVVRPGGPAAGALRIALAVLGFLAGAALIGRAIPPRLPVVTPKQEHLEAHSDAYSVIFLGTSEVHRHVIPASFSAELGRLGLEGRAFNFGAPLMTLAEAHLLLAQILALRSSSIKTIVIDLDLALDSGEANHYTPRHVWWHTPIETYFAIVRDFDGTPNWHAAGVEIKALAMNVTAFGRLSKIFQAKWDPVLFGESNEDEDVGDEGFRALDDIQSRRITEQRRDFIRDRKSYEDAVKARKARATEPRKLSAYKRRMLESIVRRVQEAGLQPILYEGPNIDAQFDITGKLLLSLPKLSFNDPNAYPDLYELDNRFDMTHLNRDGARLLTQYLAREYARCSIGQATGPSPAGAEK